MYIYAISLPFPSPLSRRKAITDSYSTGGFGRNCLVSKERYRDIRASGGASTALTYIYTLRYAFSNHFGKIFLRKGINTTKKTGTYTGQMQNISCFWDSNEL